MNQSQRNSRVSSDFSIERILSKESEKKSPESTKSSNIKNYSSRGDNNPDDFARQIVSPILASCSRLQFNDEVSTDFYDSAYSADYSEIARSPVTSRVMTSTCDRRDLKVEKNELSWLHCTRYRPPKLPRKSSNGKSCKRRPGSHPRIPFTTSQLQVLEDKYRSTAYLSRREVVQLSTTLRLPQSRVKIWFQNRRARDRRETVISGSNITILSDDAASTSRKRLNSPIQKSPTSNLL